MVKLSSTKQRIALDVLPAGRLRELLDAFALEVDNRRLRDSLKSALADGRRVKFSDVLGELSRDELKQMCDVLGLDDSGREKQKIIDRILGSEASVAGGEPRKSRSKRTSRTEEKRVVQTKNAAETGSRGSFARWIATPEKDTATTTLEKNLWDAADQFRANSGLKAQEYSGPILGLIFLRFAESALRRPARAKLEKAGTSSRRG